MPVQSLEPSDPEAVGPYRLLARIGAGGMGRVYLARSSGGRTVAIKVVRAELAEDPDFRERFRREVSAAQAVSGTYTAPVVDSDRDGPEPWLATAYVLGPSLSEAVSAHGPLPAATVRALGAGLAEALAAIHGAGLVHRDLKPSNVLLAADGPRVIDFGIARALEGERLTSTGVVVGSPGYMCPEQATGVPMGPAGDVFSLASVLVYAATGSGPFSQDTDSAAALLYRVIHEEPVLDGLPEELRPVIAACLAKDPAARPTPAVLAEAFGGRSASLHGWLPAQVSSDIAAHAATVMDMETPARGSAPVPADPRLMPAYALTEVSEAAYGEGTVRLGGAATATVPSTAPSTAPAGPSRRVLLGGGAALVAALGGSAWAMFGGSGKPSPKPGPSASPTASPPAPVYPTHRPGEAPAALWSHTLPPSMQYSLLCADGEVCVYGDGGVFSLSMKNGAQTWAKPSDSAGAVVVADGSLAYNGINLVSVDPASGSINWTYAPVDPKGASAVLDPSTVLAADEHAIYALAIYTPLDSTGAVDAGAPSAQGIMAISAKDGSVLWNQHRLASADTDISAVLAGDLLLYTDTQQDLVARSITTGEQQWVVDTDSMGVYQPGCDGTRVFCSAAKSGLQAVTIATHQQAWVKEPPAGSHDLWYSAPAVADGVVYTVLGGMTLGAPYNATPSAPPTVYAYAAADGTELWRLQLPYEVSMDTAPILVQDTLFVSTDNNGIYAVDIKAHKVRWNFQSGVGVGSAWAFSTDGQVLVAMQNITVFALPPV